MSSIKFVKTHQVGDGISIASDASELDWRSGLCDGGWHGRLAGLRATQSFAALANLGAVSICVPTPLRKTKDLDLSYVMAAVEAWIAGYNRAA